MERACWGCLDAGVQALPEVPQLITTNSTSAIPSACSAVIESGPATYNGSLPGPVMTTRPGNHLWVDAYCEGGRLVKD